MTLTVAFAPSTGNDASNSTLPLEYPYEAMAMLAWVGAF